MLSEEAKEAMKEAYYASYRCARTDDLGPWRLYREAQGKAIALAKRDGEHVAAQDAFHGQFALF